MGSAYSREKRRGGQSVRRGRARIYEFRVGELVTLKTSGTGVYQIVEAERGRVKLCNINDSMLTAWFDIEHVEPCPVCAAPESAPGVFPPKETKYLPQIQPNRPRRPDSKIY